jgi:hypothetical protein
MAITCFVIENGAPCTRPYACKDMCNTHYQRVYRLGTTDLPPRPMVTRLSNPGYSAVHARLKVDLGPASAHPCVDCGAGAHDWSYNENCDEELETPVTKKHGALRYCPHNECYVPRCKSCHHKQGSSITPRGKLQPEEVTFIRINYHTMLLKTLAQMFNVYGITITLAATGVTYRDNPTPPVSPRERKKISNEQEDECRALYATKEWRQVDLAVKYNISQAHVSRIIRNSKQ